MAGRSSGAIGPAADLVLVQRGSSLPPSERFLNSPIFQADPWATRINSLTGYRPRGVRRGVEPYSAVADPAADHQQFGSRCPWDGGVR